MWAHQARWIYYACGGMLAATAALSASGRLFADVWRALNFSAVGHTGDLAFAGIFVLAGLIVAVSGRRRGRLAGVISILLAITLAGFLGVGWLLLHVLTSGTTQVRPMGPLPVMVIGVDAGALLLAPLVQAVLFRRRAEDEAGPPGPQP